MKRIFFLFLLSAIGLSCYAKTQISLLTAGPTDEYVFLLYGHTALRVRTETQDLVYNYGYFSMQQDNFFLNFMLGKPMYSLGVTSFEDFLLEYVLQGRSVTEQVLNFSEEECAKLENKLKKNALPENRDYIYNFYFDNCATRPRDLIEQTANGLVYNIDSGKIPTFREAIRNQSRPAQWYTVGTDLCLGWKSDQRMTIKDAAFLPNLLLQELDHAYRKDNGEAIILAKIEHAPQTRDINRDISPIAWPMLTFMLLALGYAFLFFFGDKHKVGLTTLRSLIYFVLGTGGVIIWFLSLVSAHPHTYPNANMLLLHPMWYVLSASVWCKTQKYVHMNYWLYLINFVAIVIYLMLGYKQVLPQGVPILALLVGVDLLLQILAERKRTNI